eukprot:638267-Pyramimonas_sp.AAC.1
MDIPSTSVSARARCVQTVSDSYATPRPAQMWIWCVEPHAVPMWPDVVGWYLYGALLLLPPHFPSIGYPASSSRKAGGGGPEEDSDAFGIGFD